jgi:hypothetical protein
MTVLQLIVAILKDTPNLDAEVKLTVHCPHGGNSLPVDVEKIVVGTTAKALFIDLSAADGVEYEVFDRDEDEEDEDNDI